MIQRRRIEEQEALTDAIGDAETFVGTLIAVRERVKDLVQQRDELLAGLKDVFALIDEGFLVRDTSKDSDPLWALNSIRFVTRLKQANDALEKAGGA